jgi:hypothetical protein
MTNLQDVITEFTSRLSDVIDTQARQLAREQVTAALGGVGLGAPGRPPASPRQRPVQYCPVPYCRGVAAPIFGMVCAKHKDVSKAKIRKYREARKGRG